MEKYRLADCYCAWCNAPLDEQTGFEKNNGTWYCEICGHLTYGELKHESTRFKNVIWSCEGCGDILNNQDDFTDENDTWECRKCGYMNHITEDDIFDSDRESKVMRAPMNVSDAQRIRDELLRKSHLSDEENFMLTESLNFLIKTYQDPGDMLVLGGIYYEELNFDLALKYYEMAASYDSEEALINLGYIWYYGRTGEKDYKKAFEYYSKAADLGYPTAQYKVADMYKNGYYVEKDYEKYKEIIENLYPQIKNATMLGDPLPEIFTRLAKIRVEEAEAIEDKDSQIRKEKFAEAVNLYVIAKDFLAQRITYSSFFGDLNIMKRLVDDLYEIKGFDERHFDLFDFYYLLKTPNKIRFMYNSKPYVACSLMEDGNCVITFEGEWFRIRDDFFKKANINGEYLTSINQDLYLFELL